MFRRILPLVTVLILAGVGFASTHRHRHGMSISMSDSESAPFDCGRLKVSADGQMTSKSEESQSIPNQPLRVRASHNGGISVIDSSQPGYTITACKAALTTSKEEGERLLSQVHLAVRNGVVTVEGPPEDQEDEWTSFLLITAPVGATMDFNADNGGISLRGVDGNITAHATNGGIELKGTKGTAQLETTNGGVSLDHASGKITVETQNGGVEAEDCSGDVKINLQNGGLNLVLGPAWDGAGLSAELHNGGLVLELPKDFRSPLEVSTSQYTTIECSGAACAHGAKTWDDNRRLFRLGDGAPLVRASTVNGSVIIQDRGASEKADLE